MKNSKPQKKEVAKAVIWKFVERVGVNGITFAISLVLARILMPEDYGVLALLTIFIHVATALIDGGFISSLIQKKDTTQLDYCSVFWFSFLFSCSCYFVLFFLAPFIATFYNKQILVPVLRVVSLTLIIKVFQCIPFALVNKKIDFKTTARVSFISNITSGMLAIILAYKNFGVWALVIQQLMAALLSVFIYIFITKWIPKFQFSLHSLKALFDFGSKMMFLGFSSAVFDNVYGIVIGKKFDSTALGIYNRGDAFPRLIVCNVSGAMENVIFPTLTHYNEDKEKALSIVRRFVALSSYCIMPLMFGLAAIAKPMVMVLLTEKWIESVFFLRVACIVWATDPLKGVSFSTLYAFGKSDTALKFTLLRYFLVMIALFITMNLGLKIMAIGYAVAYTISRFLDFIPLSRLLDYRFNRIIGDILPSVVLSLVMFLVVYPIALLPISILTQLVIQILVGIVVYVFLSWLLKNHTFFYLVDNVSKFFKGRKNG